MNGDLFAGASGPEQISPGTWLLHGAALDAAPALFAEVQHLTATAPFRQMQTPGGSRMSVAMSNCGPFGWVTDRSGYRYAATDPLSGLPWPPLPPLFLQIAGAAAERAGYPGFVPNACLINRYAPGARMALHQDKDERDFTAPIVSLSLGLPVVFLFGGTQRSDPPARLLLSHGDVLVWGGPDRLRFHGVMPLKPGRHELLGEQRINLTFRKAR